MNNKFDKNGNLIYMKLSSGPEIWREYDENNKMIHDKDSRGDETWWERNTNGDLVHFRSNSGFEYWYKYDRNNKQIIITKQEFKQIERTKLYLNNKRINRFELMDI